MKNLSNVTMSPLGDSAVIIQLGEGISEQTHRVVSALTKRIENDPFPGLLSVCRLSRV